MVRAASNDDARPLLTGVLVAAEGSGTRLVATDSYRLALRDLTGTGPLPEGTDQILIPARALTELQRLLPAAGGKDAGGKDKDEACGGRGFLGERSRRHVHGLRCAVDDPTARREIPRLPPTDPAGLSEPAPGGQGISSRRTAPGPSARP